MNDQTRQLMSELNFDMVFCGDYDKHPKTKPEGPPLKSLRAHLKINS